ncbi:MAG: hypothetical protein GY861_12780 [bacterium]|nr:hypothetical protein [bacterium]
MDNTCPNIYCFYCRGGKCINQWITSVARIGLHSSVESCKKRDKYIKDHCPPEPLYCPQCGATDRIESSLVDSSKHHCFACDNYWDGKTL